MIRFRIPFIFKLNLFFKTNVQSLNFIYSCNDSFICVFTFLQLTMRLKPMKSSTFLFFIYLLSSLFCFLLFFDVGKIWSFSIIIVVDVIVIVEIIMKQWLLLTVHICWTQDDDDDDDDPIRNDPGGQFEHYFFVIPFTLMFPPLWTLLCTRHSFRLLF